MRIFLLPVICAITSGILSLLPFMLQEYYHSIAVPVAYIFSILFIVIGLFWKRIITWVYYGRAAIKSKISFSEKSQKQRLMLFFYRYAQLAFPILGFSFLSIIAFNTPHMPKLTMPFLGWNFVAMIMAWFAPLWINE